jgi:hypothetical protein
MPSKRSLHFIIVVYGKTSERHFRDRAECRFKRIIVSVVYGFVLLFIKVVFFRKTENVVPCRIDLGFQLSKRLQKENYIKPGRAFPPDEDKSLSIIMKTWNFLKKCFTKISTR